MKFSFDIELSRSESEDGKEDLSSLTFTELSRSESEGEEESEALFANRQTPKRPQIKNASGVKNYSDFL
ncbi:MAG: hypothetical protein Q8N87_01620 [bacterium]|nr:hypothetical protein [bacterium]